MRALPILILAGLALSACGPGQRPGPAVSGVPSAGPSFGSNMPVNPAGSGGGPGSSGSGGSGSNTGSSSGGTGSGASGGTGSAGG